MSEPRRELERVVGARNVGELAVDGDARTLPLATPQTEDELVELVRFAARDSLRVLPLGSGTKLGWCAAPERADFAVTTRALAGIVAYEPHDGTLTARAGSTMAELARAVEAGGNHLSPLVPQPTRATLGGVLAASQSGLERLRFGPARHQVLGMRVALSDGSIAKTGGRLVKNVTGYDLHRVYCGSHGTLCVIVEASMRLHAKPDAVAVLTSGELALDDALAATRRVRALDVQPWTVRIESEHGRPASFRVHVILAGGGETVAWERARVLEALPRSSEAGDGSAEVARLRELEADTAPEGPHLHIAVRPSRVAHALAQVLACAPSARIVADPALATIDAFFGPTVPELVAALVRRMRASGDSVAVRRAPAGVLRTVDPFGDPGASLPRMRRVQRALDPAGVFACGRFHGGI
ncbi:MAG: FAD-binding oxidoreductase [Planctomycetota bacterium]